jgi:cellobiose-specific phosphotransferase system component IIA
VNRWKIPAHDAQEKIEALDAEFMREIGKARQCFADAFDLMKDGKTAEAKELKREGDAAQKRAQQIFRQMKEAAQHRSGAP